MKEYEDIDDLLKDVWQIKNKVVNLKYDEVIKYRTQLYNLKIPAWKINLIWDFIWDYKSYNKLCELLSKE